MASLFPLGPILSLFFLLPIGAGSSDLPLPTEWSTYYLCLLEVNPEYQAGTRASESELTARHIQYQLLLNEQGRAIAAGGLAPLAGDPLVGLTILRADSLAQARSWAENDPAVKAGRLLARLREWWVPSSQLP